MKRIVMWHINEGFSKSKDFFDFEKGFLIQLSLAAVIFSTISLVVNVVLGFDLFLLLIPIVSTLMFLVVYFLAKKGVYVESVKWSFIVCVLFFINLTWYFNYGSHGPWFYMLVLLYSYMIFMMRRRQLLLLNLLIVSNVFVLFILEYDSLVFIGDYPSAHARIVDIYVAIILYGAFAYVLMTLAKNYYLSEYKKAKEADRLKSSFLANMSHEIRTPLNTIVGFSNLLGDDDLDEEEKQQYVSIMNQSNNSLLRLIDDVLDVSLIEADQLKIIPARLYVNQMLDILEDSYKKIIKEVEKEGVKLIKKSPPDNLCVITDAARINQVMVNLLDNAIKFTQKGQISFGCELEKDTLHFFVSDSGIGIDQKFHPHLFDRFYKVEENKETLYRGTGIGLYLSKKFVELLGGRIWVESTIGESSTFNFTIPANIVPNESHQTEQPKATDRPPMSLSGTSLLIVEDERSSFIYLTQLLKNRGILILEAITGKEALAVFKANPNVGMVLLDIKLPDLDGFEVLKEIKKINPSVPVVAQTAFAMADDEQKCYEAGFDDYISKPIPRDVLLEKISYYLGNPI